MFELFKETSEKRRGCTQYTARKRRGCTQNTLEKRRGCTQKPDTGDERNSVVMSSQKALISPDQPGLFQVGMRSWIVLRESQSADHEN